MKLGSLLGDVVKALGQKPVTQRYPAVRVAPPARFRGKLVWNPEGCSGCKLCMKDCPADALEVIALDKPPKRLVLRYYADRCTYCGQCVVNCRFNCLDMPPTTWELASTNPDDFLVYFGTPENIQEAVAREAAGTLPGQPGG